MTGTVLLLVGCAISPTRQEPTPGEGRETTEGFAIYLLAQEIPTDRILQIDLDTLALKEIPILSISDILAYSQATHRMTLTPAALERIERLQVPMTGLPFVVCVDRQPIYGGAFWVSYSSMSFHGVAIDTLSAALNRPLRLQLGYPEAPELFVGEDRRADPRILQSLEKAGKLR